MTTELAQFSGARASGSFGRLAAAARSTPVGMAGIVIALIVIFGVLSPNGAFFRVSNLSTITLNVAVTMLLAVGITFVLAAGELDLSIGSNVVLSSVVAAEVLVGLSGTSDQVRVGEYPDLALGVVAGTMAGILAGALFGAINGLLVTRLRINSFIVTLGTMGIGTGLAYVVSNGVNVPNVPRVLQTSFGIQKLFGVVPYAMVVVLVISLGLAYMLRSTRFGLHTLAIGSSREAAERAGIRSSRHVMALFILMGTLAGVAGTILGISEGNLTPASGELFLFVIFAAVILGGIGSIYGAMGGALLIGLATEISAAFINPAYKLDIAFVALILTLLIRPSGLIARPGTT